MSIIDTLITDRTAADVQKVVELKTKGSTNWTPEEVATWSAGMKGSYTHVDLNRVGQACAYLHDIMTSMGYAVPGYVALRTDWTVQDTITKAQMSTYLSTVAALKAVWSAAQPIPATIRMLGTEGANNIEKLLIELEDISQRINAIYIRSDAWNAFSGTGFYIKN